MIAALVLALVLPHGTISGTVRVASGTGISGVAITITNEKTGAKKVVTSSETGAYSAMDLAPGLYSLSIELQGYRNAVHNRKVVAGGSVTVDFDLEFKVTEEVTVNAPIEPPETTSVKPPELKPLGYIWQHYYEGPFSGPGGLFLDRSAHEIWVADTGNDLVGIFTPEGGPLFTFGGGEHLKAPVKIVRYAGRIVVLGLYRSRLESFNYRGEYLGVLPLPGLGEKPSIGTIATDETGNLYVGDSGNGEVLVFGPDQKLKLRFSGNGAEEGDFQAIAGIAVAGGEIYVVDSQARPVQVFDRYGNFLRGWGKREIGPSNFALPEGIAIDPKGRVIVVDDLRHEIKFFDRDGEFLANFGGLGPGPGDVAFPSDVAADGEGRLYVSERGNGRVQVFQEEELTRDKVAGESSQK